MRKMAVVKANYIKGGKVGNARIKATIRYIEHRRGKNGAKITRTLFGNDGVLGRDAAYRMIDEAEKGTFFYRFVMSPDPTAEDTEKDVNLWEITTQTILKLQERLQKAVLFVASEHNDHAPHRHVHVVAVVPGRLHVEDFNLLRREATEACLAQRQELDIVLDRERQARERKEAEWER